MKKVISVDWLSFSYNLSLTKDEYLSGAIEWHSVDGYSFEFLTGTNVFQHRMFVRDSDGRKVMTLLYSPKSNIIRKDLCLVEIVNSALYTNEWKNLFLLVQRLHVGEYNTLTRFDICCDFDEIGDHISQMFDNKEIYVQRKKEGCSFYDYILNDGIIERKIKQISFGSKQSKLKWKLYNKTLELKNSSKEYIRRMWMDNGLDTSKNIWRLEVSLTRCSSLECIDNSGINILSLSSILNNDSYLRLFPYFYLNNFVTRKNEGRADNKLNPNSIYNWLEITDESDFTLQLRQVGGIKFADGEILVVFNHLVNDLQRSCIKFNIATASQILETIQQLMRTFYLEDYLYNVHHLTLNDLVDMVDNPKNFVSYGR